VASGSKSPSDAFVKVTEGALLLPAAIALIAPGAKEARLAAERFLSHAKASRLSLEHFHALIGSHGRPESAVLAVTHPGRTAIFFASSAESLGRGALIRGTAALIDHVATDLASGGIELAQALLDPADQAQLDLFDAGGFKRLATLSYLERVIPASSSAPDLPPGVSLVSVTGEDLPEVEALLDATYEGTLDCPGLHGLRRTPDILAGHLASGAGGFELWTLLKVNGRAEGVLMLNPSIASDSIELVYLGLAPSARGRGLGRLLVRHGLSLLAPHRTKILSLAVDEENAPAVALYRSEGFRRVVRRVAMIRSLRR